MASTYLYRTSGTSTDAQKFTMSFWLKRSSVGSAVNMLYYSGTGGTANADVDFTAADELSVYERDASSNSWQLKTTRVFRDLGAWYHLCITGDSTLAETDRVKLYINGVRETSFSTETYPTAAWNFEMNKSSEVRHIGKYTSTPYYYDGLMSHFHFIDGTAYQASTFGETDSTSGIWKIITSPSVTYGNNGFFLKMEDRTNLDLDSSPNAHTFTTSGTFTPTYDNPSNNFATWNPLNMTTVYQPTFSNGATTCVSQDGSGNYWGSSSTLGFDSGKWYAEFKPISASNKPSFGICQAPNTHAYWESYLGKRLYDYAYVSDGTTYNNDSLGSGSWNTFTTGDIIGVAVDLDNLKIYFSKNGVWENSGDPTSGATGTGAAFTITSTAASTPGLEANGYYHFACSDQSSGQDTMAANFGNGYFQTTAVSSGNQDDAGEGDFEYDVPAGYYTLCTTNLGDQS